MGITNITNLNQYAAMLTKQSSLSNNANKSEIKDKQEPESGKADSFDKTPASKMDLATRKALAQGPLDEAELERRKNDRDYMRNANIDDVRDSMISSRRNAESVAKSQENGARFAPIQSKMLSGKLLTAEEKSFLRENYPELYAKAIQIEEEVKRLQDDLRACKSKQDADNMFMQRKSALLSGNKNDGSIMFLIPAFDNAYRGL